MSDLTIIFLTAGNLPRRWSEYQWAALREAAGDSPVIRVTRDISERGVEGATATIFDTETKSPSNIYRQMLRAAKLADTEFVAVAEDDALYPPGHFTFHRPAPDTFAYNQNRYALFTWGEPTYSWRNRKSNCTLIAPRLLLIEALEERFAKYPDGTPPNLTGELGREMVEKGLGLTRRKSEEVFSSLSVIQLNHDGATEERQNTRRKRLGAMRAYAIPHWGKAADIVARYTGVPKDMDFSKYRKRGAYHWAQYEDVNSKYRRHADRVKAWIREPGVLDIGAGDGKITSLLGGTGVENDAEAVRLAKERGANVVNGDAYALPFTDSSFEAAFMGDFLEHTSDHGLALREARRVITGHLYIASPEKGTNRDKFHYQEWTPEELEELLASEGFDLVGEILAVPEDKRIYGKFKKRNG